MSVLVVVAHPDDESFWMGGTIARLTSNGTPVSVLVLSNGVGSRGGTAEEMAQRKEQFEQACELLGATPITDWIFPDQRADTVSQLTINKAVEEHVDAAEPELVYTHHVGDLNLDHRRVAEAVLVATRGSAVRTMRPEWPSRCIGPAWAPEITISSGREGLEQKVKACLCYRDEVRDYPHPRSERAVRTSPVESFMVLA